MPSSAPPSSAPAPARAFHPLDLRQARTRLFVSLLAGFGVGLALTAMPGSPSWAVRVVAAWDAGALVLLTIAWSIIWRADPPKTRRRAAAEDPGRTAVWVVVLIANTFSVFASFAVLRRAKALAPGESAVLVGLCLAAVVGAWSLTHTAYTLRYAHLYYRDDGEGEGGLTFPGERSPDYFDFAYFAFTVGMCFQVSDVLISSPSIRRAVLGHSVLSFAYNTAIVALALNLAFGMLG
jgi:uncharacterized membrane protein